MVSWTPNLRCVFQVTSYIYPVQYHSSFYLRIYTHHKPQSPGSFFHNSKPIPAHIIYHITLRVSDLPVYDWYSGHAVPSVDNYGAF